MLTERIIGAFTFRSGVYKEVEEDTTFTTTAWLLVIVVAFLEQLGSNASLFEALGSRDLVNWLIASLGGTIFAVIGFAVAAFVINWMGRAVFNADVTFNELVRTLGLAYVWHVVGVLGVLSAFSTALACLMTPAAVVAWILGLIAWFVATKEALDLEWGQTIATAILAWIVQFVITIIGVFIIGLLGLTVAVLGGLVTF